MALTFGANTSDRVTYTAGSSINNLTPVTVACWVRPTTLTDNRRIFSKTAGLLNMLRLSSTGGNVNYQRARATTNCSFITNSTPLATIGAWRCLVATYDELATPSTHIYVGSLTTAMAECTYGTATSGVGVSSDDSSFDLKLANIDGNTMAFQGEIAVFAFIARVLSLAEVQRWQWNPSGVPDTRLLSMLGWNGTGTQYDQSGTINHGVVTGATVADDPPVFLGPRRRLWIVAPAAGDAAYTQTAYRFRNDDGSLIAP